ncbi:L,D-transpeptidase [Paenibacillus sp. LHD-117]|uniref:L,D-transpeptidase n=1 Tax=Paenibacillus sp. LHD-117 TaxID=3071412 RepID=UPI0027DF7995|nr:L,D-transpeptidase [Paenibacillus sp. LHD-117]MDQ6423307.1 L,D-transpeptidase [Paenibacillus sp. LHD-117]
MENPKPDHPQDLLYLKQFVKQHPDNKMGWYLLGKHYLRAGKEGKANYCFIQAGDIYDAFEQESHPLAVSSDQLAELKAWEKRVKRKRLLRNVTVIAVPLMLLAFLMPSIENGRHGRLDDSAPMLTSAEPGLGVVLVPRKETEPAGYAFGEVMNAGGAAPANVIAAHLEEKSGWKQWSGNARLLLELDRSGETGLYEVTMLDRVACNCEPSDAKFAKDRFEEWKKEQEQHWTLASAITHYKRMYGKWPKSLDSLIRPYPNNILAGESDGMAALFPMLLSKLKQAAADKGAAKPQASGSKGSADGQGQAAGSPSIGTNGLFQPDWSKPLEIVVDVSNHTLAVIHNGLIVRGYRVGLGGDKTPEGSFFISEKVRDPNGGDGIFGSRGMTLSNTLYAIHGTDDPDSIGKDESLGCIRMGEADVQELFDLVPLGTAVQIKNGTLPPDAETPTDRFRLAPRQDETNPAKVYRWLT